MRVQRVRRTICPAGYSGHRRGSRHLAADPVQPAKLGGGGDDVPEPPAPVKLSLFTDGADKPTISKLSFHRSLARLAGRLTSPLPVEDFSCQ